MSKEAFRYVLEEIQDFYECGKQTQFVPPIIKLAAACRFFADGSYQQSTGNDFNLGLAQSTVSVFLKETLHVLENHICEKVIVTKMSDEEKCDAKRYFFRKYGFPGVVGAVVALT